jgi:hypothetical protein
MKTIASASTAITIRTGIMGKASLERLETEPQVLSAIPKSMIHYGAGPRAL